MLFSHQTLKNPASTHPKELAISYLSNPLLHATVMQLLLMAGLLQVQLYAEMSYEQEIK